MLCPVCRTDRPDGDACPCVREILAKARSTLEQVDQVLAAAETHLAPPERRRRGRPRGGRRVDDPILDIRTHAAPWVSVGQVAAYWGYSETHIRRLLRAHGVTTLHAGRDERLRTTDVAALEGALFMRRPSRPDPAA